VAQTPPPANQDTPKLALSTADAVADGSLSFFTRSEYATLEALAKTIVPAVNERPGAVDAGVPRFLDFLLSQSPEDRQSLYRDGLRAMEGFTPQSLAALQQPWTFEGPKDRTAAFLRALKDDLLQATVNSREWAASSRTRTGGGTSYYYFPLE
jgi:hypothetical protein